MDQADPRPRSAVSGGVGWAGMAGLAAWFAVSRHFGMDGPYAALVAVAACGLPMVLWSLIVDKVHRNPTTGLDWSRPPRPLRESWRISAVKLIGLWGTWAAVAAFYCLARWYWQGQYLFAIEVMVAVIPLFWLGSIPYMLWLDRRLREPRDGAWAAGLLMLLRWREIDRDALIEHGRSWAVKAFFTAFMISIVPGNWADTIARPGDAILAGPATIALYLIAVLFMIDVTCATVGYLLTLKPLDAHIRSANPFVAGWTAALMCYPPFILMGAGGPLDYHFGTMEWFGWFDRHPALLALFGVVLVALTGVYAWATVVFGLRFSNLTNRGIITHGPYRWTKHPAYVAKNLFWWIGTLPFLATTGNVNDSVRNTVVLGLVSGVYYWRARTEERHLMADPAYRDYAAWMARNGPIPRAMRWLRSTRGSVPIAAE